MPGMLRSVTTTSKSSLGQQPQRLRRRSRTRDRSKPRRPGRLASSSHMLALVVDDQDAAAHAGSGARGRNTEKRLPAPGVRCDVDPAAVLAHDAVRHREAKARALADVLGGEERLEDARQRARAGCRRPGRATSRAAYSATGRPVTGGRDRSLAAERDGDGAPRAMAWIPLTTRFVSTCWIWPASIHAGTSAAPSSVAASVDAALAGEGPQQGHGVLDECRAAPSAPSARSAGARSRAAGG